MSIKSRLDDAEVLWKSGRLEGAFVLALIAVAATSRRAFPSQKDGEAFENFLNQGWFKRLSVEYKGKAHPIFHIFYKWFRCELIHEGALPLDIEFMPDPEPGVLSVRAGGAPNYVLKVSYGWFQELVKTVTSAEVNRDLFTM
ncbi:MAG: hypothetical protein ACLPXT_15400 [Terracidiphilus sp.]